MNCLIRFGIAANSYMRLNNIDSIFQTTYIECGVNGQALKIGWKNWMSVSTRSWHLIVLTSMEKAVRQRKVGKEEEMGEFHHFHFYVCSSSLTPRTKSIPSIGRKWLSTCWHQFRFLLILFSFWPTEYQIIVLLLAHKHIHKRKWPTKTMNTKWFWYK